MATPRNPNARPAQFNAGGLRYQEAARGLARVRQQNAQRVKCPHCDLLILPGAMHVHIEIVHGGQD